MRIFNFLFFMTTLTLSPGFSFSEQPKIAVIGAGLSGLTTAYRLKEKGLDVDVYEARERTGGRIFSAVLNGSIIELGGQNLSDGGDAAHMKKLISELSLEICQYQLPFKIFYFLNNKFSEDISLFPKKHYSPESLKTKLQSLAQKATNMKEVLDGLLGPDHPSYSAVATRLSAYEGGPIERLSPIYIETLYHLLLGGISAAHKASDEEETLIELLTIKGGNSRFTEALANCLQDKVHCNMVLAKVSREKEKYALHFTNGQKAIADILVLTMPCSVYSDIEWEGIIPQAKLKTIEKVEYGLNAKIVFSLQEPLAKRTACLNESAICFGNAEGDTMNLYLIKEASHFSSNTLKENYQSHLPMIKSFLGNNLLEAPTFSYAEDKANGIYSGVVGYSWPNDPYVKGSYSYVPVGMEESFLQTETIYGELVKSLFAPINGTLFFAGEHTSTLYDVPATMEAACESGEKAARMILYTLKQPNNKT